MKYSIIVPVHNVEKYIKECVNSILNQEEKDFELILVVNASKDKSGDICRDFAKKDGRITVLETETPGASNARNMGIDVAKGEWIFFVDSDDYITGDALSVIGSNVSEKTEMLIGNLGEGSDKFSKAVAKLSAFDYRKALLDKHYYFSRLGIKLKWNALVLDGPTAKLYKKDIIDKYNLRFDTKIIIGEDFVFNMNYTSHISEIVTVDYPIYFYRVSDDSISHAASEKACFDRIGFIRALNEMELEPELANAKKQKLVDILLRTVFIYAKIKGDKSKAKEAIIAEIKEDYMQEAIVFARGTELHKAKYRNLIYRETLKSLKRRRYGIALKKAEILVKLRRVLK